ncbi:hypothetical protein GSS87_03825 [Corynebacterium sp. 4HC-13]|uniref:YceI family protein n=1 Tax=Corynebacterium anserum TaxID=2684406 RepID=UPI00163AB2E8|nr:YceI family protein [Corynebacterium anserum]MBC2681530.1 hypothetical protein [Corynebacterium anserum]
MRKGIITLGVIGIIFCLLFAFGPIVMHMINDKGLKAADMATGGEPASIGMDGSWYTVQGYGSNSTQAGYTFFEKLPAESKTTSGRTDNLQDEHVHGELTVKNEMLTAGKVEVDVAAITSDNQKRDNNVRKDILHTTEFPKATFSLTKPVDISRLPSDGKVAPITVTGDLTLHGVTKRITTELKVLRTGESVIVQGNIPVKRSDFKIDTGQFVAAVIQDEGTIDLLLVFQQKH